MECTERKVSLKIKMYPVPQLVNDRKAFMIRFRKQRGDLDSYYALVEEVVAFFEGIIVYGEEEE